MTLLFYFIFFAILWISINEISIAEDDEDHQRSCNDSPVNYLLKPLRITASLSTPRSTWTLQEPLTKEQLRRGNDLVSHVHGIG